MNRRNFLRAGWGVAASGIIVPKLMPLLGERLYRPSGIVHAHDAVVRLLDADGRTALWTWMARDPKHGFVATFPNVDLVGEHRVRCEIPFEGQVVYNVAASVTPNGGHITVMWPGVEIIP